LVSNGVLAPSHIISAVRISFIANIYGKVCSVNNCTY
jgi:hypothetical protein